MSKDKLKNILSSVKSKINEKKLRENKQKETINKIGKILINIKNCLELLGDK